MSSIGDKLRQEIPPHIRRLEMAVVKRRAEERQQIADCVRDKSSMPANYWQERWKAEQRLKAAQILFEAVMEDA